jgi:hypothetical protein
VSAQSHRAGAWSAKVCPTWVAVAFFVGCAVIVPQIIHLTNTLPHRAIANHWRGAWVVLDIGEAILMALTGWFLIGRSAAVIVTGSMLTALLWMDAWFDVITSVGRANVVTAILLAVFVELPMSGLCLFVVMRNLRAVRLAADDADDAEEPERDPEG